MKSSIEDYKVYNDMLLQYEMPCSECGGLTRFCYMHAFRCINIKFDPITEPLCCICANKLLKSVEDYKKTESWLSARLFSKDAHAI